MLESVTLSKKNITVEIVLRFLRVLVWILKGLMLLVLTFAVLLLVSYKIDIGWLTDKSAVGILTAVLFAYCAISVLKIVKKTKPGKRKDKQNVKRPGYGKVIIAVILVELVVLAGLNAEYKFLSRETIEEISESIIVLPGEKEADIPENVREFGEKYPEAKEYVRNFNKYKDTDFDMDVTSEMRKQDIPLFIQWDKRWGYKDYGGNYVGVAGCGPTCLAMIVCGLKNDPAINPYEVSKYSADSNFYIYGEGTSWSLMTEGAQHYGLNVSEGTISPEYIIDNLSSSTPMICSMTPGDFTTSGHFIVLTGVDSNGKIIVNDPNSRKNSKKHWDADKLASQTKRIWRYCA